MSAINLATLVGSRHAGAFLDDYWPKRPFVDRESEDRRGLFAKDLGAWSAEEMLAAYDSTVTVLLPDGQSRRVENGADAGDFYRNGHTCYLRRVHENHATLAAAAEQLAADLGVPRDMLTVEVFCSTGSSGVGMHADYDVNFATLVQGEKEWTIAPNRQIENQTKALFAGSDRNPPSQLAIGTGGAIPDDMPEDAQVHVMGPGGLLVLPRGWWHQTRARGDCFQVNFVVKGPTWAEVVTQALGEYLHRDPRWREFAHFAYATDDQQRQQACARLADMLQELVAGVSERGGEQEAPTLADTVLATYAARVRP